MLRYLDNQFQGKVLASETKQNFLSAKRLPKIRQLFKSVPFSQNKHFVFCEAGNLWSRVPTEYLWLLLLQDLILPAVGRQQQKNLNALFSGGGGQVERNETNFWFGPRGEIQDDVTWRSGNEWKPSRASMNGWNEWMSEWMKDAVKWSGELRPVKVLLHLASVGSFPVGFVAGVRLHSFPCYLACCASIQTVQRHILTLEMS